MTLETSISWSVLYAEMTITKEPKDLVEWYGYSPTEYTREASRHIPRHFIRRY